MSQRGNAGFNPPSPPVGALDPLGAAPGAWCFSIPLSSATPGEWAFQSLAVGVPHGASLGPVASPAAILSDNCAFVPRSVTQVPPRRSAPECSRPPSPSAACGVGHPVQAGPDVRRADGASRQIGGPHGISKPLQATAHSGEPLAPKTASNLLSKHHWRA